MFLIGGEVTRVTTPTATETVLPWKRDDETEDSAPLQQSEFPAWASNKEYLAYNSPSATFLGKTLGNTLVSTIDCSDNIAGGLENSRSSVIGLFRRDSAASGHISSCESSPQKERRSSSGPNAVILIEEGVTDPLGVLQRQVTIPPPQTPQTPNQRRQIRRGSMLEITGCVDDTSNSNTQTTHVRRFYFVCFVLLLHHFYWKLPNNFGLWLVAKVDKLMC